MQALLSPHSSTALVFQPQPVLLGSEPTPCSLSPAEIAAWLAAHEELHWLTADSMEQLEKALSLYSRQQEALDLVLICLDDDLSMVLRDEAQQELETFLADPVLAAWLTDLFHVRPLPASADVASALSQARDAHRTRLMAWFEPIISRQKNIAQS